MVHAKGGLVYCDGANLNALLGVARPGDIGLRRHAVQPAQDLHHAARRRRTRLPVRSACQAPRAVPARPRHPQARRPLSRCDFDRPKCIGRLRTFFGNFGMWVRAYALIREWGAEGLKQAAQLAVLNANYLRAR